MEIVTTVLQAPINTIFIIAGIAIVYFALFEVSKGTIRLRKGKANFTPLIVGAIFIFGGLLYRPENTIPAQPTQEFTISTATQPLVIASDTLSPTATETQSPTIAPSDTPEPTSTPQTKTLFDGCIATQTWQGASTDDNTLSQISSQNNCWNLNSLGFVADSEGTLHLVVSPSNAETMSGIHTPVRDQSVIEFKVHVNDFYIVYDEKPAYISFSIAPQDNPMAGSGSGRFKLQIKDPGDLPSISFTLADTTESNGHPLTTQHYLYGRTYTIRLELKGIFMDVYINNNNVKETITIPSGAKSFYIGYYLPLRAGVDMEIKDIIIDGVNQ